MSDWLIGAVAWLFVGFTALFGPIFSTRLRDGLVRNGEISLRRAVDFQRKRYGERMGLEIERFMQRVFSRERHLRAAYFFMILHGPFAFVTLLKIWWNTRTSTSSRAK